jgi:hypothetical protein
MTKDKEYKLSLTKAEFSCLAGLVELAAKELGLRAVRPDVYAIKQKMEAVADQIAKADG